MDASLRVALVDDHPIVLDGLEQLFRLEGIEVVGRCRDVDDGLRVVRRRQPDVLVLDLMMPGSTGLDLLRALNGSDAAQKTKVVVLTAVADDEQLLEAIRLGAQGVVLKEMAPQLLVTAVREVHAGAQWFERGLGGRGLRRLLRRDLGEEASGSRLLSEREKEIIRLLAQGMRNLAIADRLGIRASTVKTHVHNVFEKLGVSTRIELANYAREHGLL